MAVNVLYQADILIDGIAASTDMNKVKYTTTQEVKEVTAFGDVARHLINGVYSHTADGNFYYQTGTNMLASGLESEIGPGNLPTFVPNVVAISHSQTAGDLTFIFQGALASLQHEGSYGEVLKGSFQYQSGQGLSGGRSVMATRLIRAASAVVGTSGLGPAIQLGALTAAQTLYAALNVVGTTGGAAGTQFSIISAPTSTFAAPSTRITFVNGTSGRLGEWGPPAAGAIADTWFAAKWTGYTGTGATVSIAAGIQ